MSRRPKASEPAISLFSFLDTLMCTMGALILLLIGLSIKMRPNASLEELLKSAGQPVLESPAAEAPPAELPPRYTAEDRERDLAERAARRAGREAEWSGALAQAQSERDRERAAVEKRKRALAEVDRKLQNVQSRIEIARDEAERADEARRAAIAAEKKLKGLEEQVVQQIEATRRNLDIEQRKQATRANEFAIVPYDGTSGTMRRPIYIECYRNGFRFLSENVYVGPEHLDGFTRNFNPLLTGTQALLRYWNARRIESGGDEPEPYVLLIVRPSGIQAYGHARDFLASVGANFGYELVEEDLKLAVPDVDPQAQAVLRDAIEITLEARAKVRESLAAAGAGQGGSPKLNGNHRGLSRGEANEGFEGAGRFGGDGSGGRSLAGGAPGGPGSPGGNPRGGARALADEPGEGFAGGTAPNPGQGTGRGGSGGAATAGSRTLAGNIAGGRGGGTARGGLASGGGFGEGGPDDRGLTGSDSSGTNGTGGANGGGYGGSAKRGASRGGARPATLSGQDADFSSDDGSGQGNARRGSRRTGPAGVGGDGGDEPTMEPLPDEFGPPRGNSPRMVTTNGPRAPGRLRTLEPDGEVTDATNDVNAPAGTGVRSSGAARRGAGGPATAGTPSAGSGQAGTPGGGEVGESSGGTVSLGQNSGGESSGDRPPPGGRRQFGHSHARAGTGLEKKLEIHTWRDRLMIGPDDSTISVHPGEKNEELLQRVMGGIQQTAQNWGPPPGKHFYWIPAVKFVVHPGGNGAYERLRGPLEKQGISSSVQYATDKPAEGSAGGPRP